MVFSSDHESKKTLKLSMLLRLDSSHATEIRRGKRLFAVLICFGLSQVALLSLLLNFRWCGNMIMNFIEENENSSKNRLLSPNRHRLGELSGMPEPFSGVSSPLYLCLILLSCQRSRVDKVIKLATVKRFEC